MGRTGIAEAKAGEGMISAHASHALSLRDARRGRPTTVREESTGAALPVGGA